MLLTLAVLCFATAYGLDLHHAPENHLREWEQFKLKYGKHYTDAYHENEEQHFNAFVKNLERIEQHNREAAEGKHSYTVGLNEYADFPHEQFTNTMNGFKPRHDAISGATFVPPAHSYLPSLVDWRNDGVVTPVKNQGQCGSCWSFSSTGSLEGQLARKNGRLTSLSEQNLVDCVTTNYGCGGGFMDHSFQYIKENGGIDTEKSYPYTAKQGPCKYSEANRGGYDTGFVDVPHNESSLQQAVAHVGPIAVAIDASHWSFQMYKKGIYYEPACSSTYLDHAVLAVGYGSENGQDYWLVKNSWGETWGDNGYIKMARNRENNCGIATMASYPTV